MRPILVAIALVATLVAGAAGSSHAQSRALTFAEAVASGSAPDVEWFQPGTCGATWAAGPPGTTATLTLDCTNYRPGSAAAFTMFNSQPLVVPWRVESFAFTAGIALVVPSGNDPRTRIRLVTGPNSLITSTITIMIAPTLPDPFSQCTGARQQAPFDYVCQADFDCGLGVTPVAGEKPQFCSVPCGNRCMSR